MSHDPGLLTFLIADAAALCGIIWWRTNDRPLIVAVGLLLGMLVTFALFG